MIIRERTTVNMLFTLTGSIVPCILPHIIFSAVMGVFAIVIDIYATPRHPIRLSYTPLAVYGIALSMFLGFKNSASYDRWWESRKQWGAQVIIVRNLGKLLRSLCPNDHPEVVKIMTFASAHSHAMRFQYTANEEAQMQYKSFLTEEEQAFVCENKHNKNVADNILYLASEAVRRLHKSDPPVIDTFGLVALQEQISNLGIVQGSCDRLVVTPLPFTYSMLIYRTTFVFICVAPFSMVDDQGWWTPGINACVAYVFFGLEELSHRLEQPFGPYPSSMPLEALCRSED
jgi:putative membrane protein